LILFILTGIQFCHILDFMILMPLGPKLMKLFSINATQFGILVSSYTIASAITGVIGSAVTDRYDRKKLLSFLFAGFTIGTFFCVIANSFTTLLLARVMAGCFGGILNALIFTIVSDLIPYERRGKAIGTIMSAFSISSVVGVPFGLYLSNQFNWHAPFILLTGMCGVLHFFIIKDIPSIADHLQHQKVFNLLDFFNTARKKIHLMAFSVTFFMMLSGFTIIPYISAYMVKNVGVSEMELSYIYLSGGAFTIFTSRFIGKLVDNFGAIKILGGLVFLAFLPILHLTHHGPSTIWVALLTSVPFMVFVSGRMVPAMTLVTRAPSAVDRGMFLSLNSALQSLGIGVASYIGGLILSENAQGQLMGYDHNGYLACLFGLCALFMAILLNQQLQKKI
jgi:predicted MFS family arabinose efflux permease